MPVNKEAYQSLITELKSRHVKLVAVSKNKPAEDILALYESGQRDFAENYVQELVEKQKQLPDDIRWHFIGHLQSNKVKQIASFVHLIQSVDSLKLLKEINKQAEKNGRVIDCLLQIHIAQEETKFGLDEQELDELMSQYANLLMKNVRIIGMMGMASFTDDMDKVRNEFKYLQSLFNKLNQPLSENDKLPTTNYQLPTLSMGMSSDYKIAIEEGSTMVRIGSLVFGERT
ncbi:MAG: YggS family pyridoxal phosphate-dependent enzyme [Parafilimonas sp.]